MNKPVVALVAVLACAACASSPRTENGATAAQPAALNPVGTFDFTTSAEGTDVSGSITITRSGTGYAGTITTSVTDPIPVTSVTVEGQTMNVLAQTPDGQLTMSLLFTGDDFTGNWTLAGGQMSGAMSGKRRVS